MGASCFNLWLPLDSVGNDLPSLDVVAGSHRVMRKLPLLTGRERYRDDAFVPSTGHAATPLMALGDALAIDLHRTQAVGSEHSSRTACEFRFFI